MRPSNLMRVAEVIRLSARTAQLFPDTATSGNGQLSRVIDLGQQIEALADELLGVARELDASASNG